MTKPRLLFKYLEILIITSSVTYAFSDIWWVAFTQEKLTGSRAPIFICFLVSSSLCNVFLPLLALLRLLAISMKVLYRNAWHKTTCGLNINCNLYISEYMNNITVNTFVKGMSLYLLRMLVWDVNFLTIILCNGKW